MGASRECVHEPTRRSNSPRHTGAGEIPATPALLQQRSSVTPASPPLTLTCLYLMFFSSVVLGTCMYTFGCTMSTYISNKNVVEILKHHRCDLPLSGVSAVGLLSQGRSFVGNTVSNVFVADVRCRCMGFPMVWTTHDGAIENTYSPVALGLMFTDGTSRLH